MYMQKVDRSKKRILHEKTEAITLRLTPEHRAAAEVMAEHWLCSLSEAFRRAVLEMARAREALVQRSLEAARERR
jgi:hypothetical protein